MSEDEMEKFEITDYDLENEFSMYRNRKGPTKHQQIYGKPSIICVNNKLQLAIYRHLG